MKARIEQIGSDYPSKLEKKIAKKQVKLDKLLARNSKTDFSNENAVKEKDFSKDIRSSEEIKQYYEKKIEECLETVSRNVQVKKDMNDKIENLKCEFKFLKEEHRRMKGKGSSQRLRESKVLKKSLRSASALQQKSLHRLSVNKMILKNALFKSKAKEKSLNDLLGEISFVSHTPNINCLKSVKSSFINKHIF